MATLHEAGKIIAIAARGVPPEEDLTDALMEIMRRAARSQSASMSAGEGDLTSYRIVGATALVLSGKGNPFRRRDWTCALCGWANETWRDTCAGCGAWPS